MFTNILFPRDDLQCSDLPEYYHMKNFEEVSVKKHKDKDQESYSMKQYNQYCYDIKWCLCTIEAENPSVLQIWSIEMTKPHYRGPLPLEQNRENWLSHSVSKKYVAEITNNSKRSPSDFTTISLPPNSGYFQIILQNSS